jgi:hypothetical protein
MRSDTGSAVVAWSIRFGRTMRSEWWRVALAASLVLLSALPAAAKKPIEKITISGAGLETPVEVTDEAALRLSNPWWGRFIDWNARPVDRPRETPVYDVTLHARLRSPELRPIYQFRYAPGTNGRRGLVYLPGKGEPGHRQNVSIILRSGHDGNWNPAGTDWEARIKAALGR